MTKDPLTWGPDDVRLAGIPFDQLYYVQNIILPIKRSVEFPIIVDTSFRELGRKMILQIGQEDISLQHLYTYCKNNPVNYIDPDGQGWWAVSGGIGAGAGFIGGAITHRLITGSWKGVWKSAFRSAIWGGITGMTLPFGWGWGALGGGVSGGIDYLLFGGSNRSIERFVKSTGIGTIVGGVAGGITKWILTPRWIILK